MTIKVGDKEFDEKIPLEHKFITTPLGSQDVYIMKQQEEGAKGKLVLMNLNLFRIINRIVNRINLYYLQRFYRLLER